MSKPVAVIRIDRGIITRKPFVTDQGHIRCDANATRIGVLPYLNADGSIRWELRHPDEVFHPRSLESLAGAPITLGHPQVDGRHVLVTPDNWQQFGKGTVGDRIKDPKLSNPYVTIEGLNIQAGDAIEALAKGNKQLSPGYQVISYPESGTWYHDELAPDGIKYTHRQYGIEVDGIDEPIILYNHLALMDVGQRGRSGPDVRILNFDGFEAGVQVDVKPEKPVKVYVSRNDGAKMSKSITWKGVNYHADADTNTVAVPMDVLQGILDTLNQLMANETQEEQALAPTGMDSLEKLIADWQTVKGELATTKAELAKRVDASELNKLVAARSALLSEAKSILGDSFNADASDLEIRSAVVKKYDASLISDGTTPEEITGMYRAAVKFLAKADSAIAKQAATVQQTETKADAEAETRTDARSRFEQARRDMAKRRNGMKAAAK